MAKILWVLSMKGVCMVGNEEEEEEKQSEERERGMSGRGPCGREKEKYGLGEITKMPLPLFFF